MQPKIYSSKEHHIRNDLIDTNALAVLERLHNAGFTAYLVGGSVRDLLMHRRPKDFDISTSARPEEIKRLFRNCILIGRRFRLAHIRFGKQIIEVSTFRAGDPTEEELIVRDNIWGTPEEDVLRRDFTINGLFYDPLDHKIIDYVGGFEDLQKHLLRSIGNPEIRFKQDPVRMIRLVKFRARFGFHIDTAALEGLYKCRQEIIKSSPARILEEIFRMLESGSSEAFFRLLFETEFLKILFPTFNDFFHRETSEMIFDYLKAIDAMNQQAPLDRSVLTAALLYPILEQEIRRNYLLQDKIPHIGEIMQLSQSLIHDLFVEAFAHFPRKIRLLAFFILHMQYRLTPLDPKRKMKMRMVKQKEFILALNFLKVRALIDDSLFKSYNRWKHLYHTQNKEE